MDFSGTLFHDLTEKLESGKITKEKAIEEWNLEIDMYEFAGDLNFPTIKSKENYIKDIELYFKNFEPLNMDRKEVLVEEEFSIDFEGIIIRGFIDLTLIDHEKKEIEVIDYKTSSKSGFTNKNLIKKCYQLILYGIALKQKYPDYKIVRTAFDMSKYGKHKDTGKVKERKDILIDEEKEYERYFIEIPFNQENINLFKEFVNKSMKNINKAKEENKWEVNKTNFSFFCGNLCSTAGYCKEYQKYQKKNKYKK